MTRLTQRMSAMWTSVKCPRCRTLVQPERLTAGEGTAAVPADDGKRWSFLWRPPRGDFCPDCGFPLSKYFGRLKWIRTVTIGLAIALVFLALQILGFRGFRSPTYMRVMRGGVLLGVVVALVGMVGIVIGGKRGPVRASDRT